MSTTHMFRTSARGAEEVEGDLVEGRGAAGAATITVLERNLWCLVTCPDIEMGDEDDDPNGWWDHWEHCRLDPAKFDAHQRKAGSRARSKMAAARRLTSPGDAQYQTSVSLRDAEVRMPWAVLKSLCSRRRAKRRRPLRRKGL